MRYDVTPPYDALFGIVGHELSHLEHGHQLLDLKKIKLAEQFLNGGTTLMRLWSRSFRPEDESAADRDGATWAYKAGYDPREMTRMFMRLNERHPDGRGFVPAFFRTHPFNADRQEAVMARVRGITAGAATRDAVCRQRESAATPTTIRATIC